MFKTAQFRSRCPAHFHFAWWLFYRTPFAAYKYRYQYSGVSEFLRCFITEVELSTSLGYRQDKTSPIFIMYCILLLIVGFLATSGDAVGKYFSPHILYWFFTIFSLNDILFFVVVMVCFLFRILNDILTALQQNFYRTQFQDLCTEQFWTSIIEF